MKYLVILAVLFYADYYYKRKVEREMTPGKDVRIAGGGRFLIRRAENKGVAGGLLDDKAPFVRLAATGAAGIAFLRFLTLLPSKKHGFRKAAYAIFLAGALSNLYDRWVRGRVTDYISVVSRRVKGLRQIIFNLGDVFILTGGVMLYLAHAFGRKK